MIKQELKTLLWFWLFIAAVLLMTMGCQPSPAPTKVIQVQPVIIVIPDHQYLDKYQANIVLL